MTSRPGVTARRIGASVLAMLAAIAVVPVKAALNTWIGDDVGFIPAIATVVMVAWLGGFLPGAAATATGIVVEAAVFMEPRGVLVVAAESDRLRLALFGLTGAFASWLAWLRTSAEERARALHEDAARARDRADLAARRLEALQAIAAELAGVMSTDRITEVVLARGITALRADGAAIFLVEPGGEALDAIAWTGYGEDRARSLETIPLAVPLPATDAARTGEPVFIEDPAVYAARYGPTLVERGMTVEPRAVAAVPLEVEGRRFGALGFTWNHPHELAPDRQAFIVSIARLAAGTMDRARLFDAERDARHGAEATQRRLDLLAEAGRALGMTLDYETTLRRLAGLALPLMGDVGIVDVLEERAVRRLVATATGDLAGPASVIEAHPTDPAGSGPISEVLRTGRPGIYVLDEGSIATAARGPAHAAALQAVAARWALVVPMRVVDRTIGALTFLRREERRFDPAEVAVAEELGDRAGRALLNARLHSEVARLAETELRHAAELEAVIAAIGEGILVADGDGSVRSSNVAAMRLLGGPVSSVDVLLERLTDADGRRPAGLVAGPVEYRLADRPTAWVEVSTYPVAEAGGIVAPSTVVICRDVTAFRQGQALREAFLGLLSHELRTPVTTIYGGSAVLARPGTTLDRATSNDILADIVSEADRLYRLVEDLLVLARFDEGFELGDEPALLQHLVPAVVDQERGRWPAVSFEVVVAPDLPAVSGDETSITQVLRNLLSNAAKYSAGGTVVTAIVEPVAEGVAVRVQDEGPGINPAEAEELFNPFYRSPSTAKMAGGAGIGLYVSRRLVDAMNGHIWAAPREGRGSEFAFVLPCYRAEVED